jgi:hypothetical protein
VKRPPIKSPRLAWCVVDTDGSLCLGLIEDRRRDAAVFARHPMRRVVRVKVSVVRPKAKRGAR